MDQMHPLSTAEMIVGTFKKVCGHPKGGKMGFVEESPKMQLECHKIHKS